MRNRAVGSVVLLALVCHFVVDKWPHAWQEMLFACHVATALVGIGALLGRQTLIGAGYLFHVGFGGLGWMLDMASTGVIGVTSTLVHVMPLVGGFWMCRHYQVSRRSIALAFAMCCVLLPVSYFATPAHLNVNLAHGPWPPLAFVVPWLWFHYAVTLASVFVMLLVARWLHSKALRLTRGAQRTYEVVNPESAVAAVRTL